MTSSTVVAKQEADPARPVLDGPDRSALRAAIRAAVAHARPRPVAIRTLELLAEAASVPDAAGTSIRVLDRQGAVRLRGDTAEPMTLADLVAELRERHPALFLPPEAEPVPATADEARDSALLSGAYEMTAATARFVGTQSERARSLAERSSEQGRVLAQSAAGRFATLGTRLRGRFGRPPASADAAGGAPQESPQGAPREPDPAAAWNAGPGRFGETVRDGLDHLRDRLGFGGAPMDDGARRQRRWLLGAGAGTLAAVIAAGLVLEGQTPDSARPAAPARTDTANGAAPSVPPTASPAPASPAPAAPDTVTPPPETAGDPEPDAPLPPNAVTGQAQVIDTATLKVGGKVVHLFGVEWVRGGQADELARYIGTRPVTCQPAPGSATLNCLVDGRDISEVVLFNGGGRASPEASPELVAAEDHARSERLGVWKR
ncbi:nuclease [Methylobacterium sp. J-026]|uniref:nuclease n=1 Tax=Methylobacterium sp. J-026 TaxID=2836624 RepID=UPI001FBA7EF4|nr:nuclease [Methylobacterium sp. J-026]MCJ2137253.1 nuclease [Methylobacterium sp. J-026]